MGVWRGAALLLATVATVSSVRDPADDDNARGNENRLITVCSEDEMKIYLTKDFGKIYPNTYVPCPPTWTNFTDFDGSVIPAQVWTFSRVDGSKGSGCALDWVQVGDLWAHEIFFYGFDTVRGVRCIRPGNLSTEGAIIHVDALSYATKQSLPTAKRIVIEGTETEDSGRPVEVARSSQFQMIFHHEYPKAAGLSLYPLNCWLYDDRNNKKRLVLENGCPLHISAYLNQTLVSLGGHPTSSWNSEGFKLYFNAVEQLFPGQAYFDQPPFHFQCEVMLCRGDRSFSQVVGVDRCPRPDWCSDYPEFQRDLDFTPQQSFEINMTYSLKALPDIMPLAGIKSLGKSLYYPRRPRTDTQQTNGQGPTMSAKERVIYIFAAIFSVGVLIAIGLAILNIYLARMQRIQERKADLEGRRDAELNELRAWPEPEPEHDDLQFVDLAAFARDNRSIRHPSYSKVADR